MDNNNEIHGVGNDNNVVAKTKETYAITMNDLSIEELQIVDIYLSRINSHDPDNRTVIFYKDEIEKLFHGRVNRTELNDRFVHLLKNVIRIENPNDANDFSLITLFSMAHLKKNENGAWEIALSCTEEAKICFFNPDDAPYFRYRLRIAMALPNRNNFRMFNYIANGINKHKNRHKKNSSGEKEPIVWTEELSNLLHLLGLDKRKSYHQYKYLNREILKPACAEINQKTNCKFSYEPIRHGQVITAILFTVSAYPEDNEILDIDVDENQLSIDDICEENKSGVAGSLQFLSDQFSPAQIEAIKKMVEDLPENQQESVVHDAYMTFANIYNKKLESGDPIYNKFTYFKKVLETKLGNKQDPIKDPVQQAAIDANLKENLDWLMQFKASMEE